MRAVAAGGLKQPLGLFWRGAKARSTKIELRVPAAAEPNVCRIRAVDGDGSRTRLISVVVVVVVVVAFINLITTSAVVGFGLSVTTATAGVFAFGLSVTTATAGLSVITATAGVFAFILISDAVRLSLNRPPGALDVHVYTVH